MFLSTIFLRQRMAAVVHFHKVFKAYLGIALRGAEPGVAKELLDGTQVGARRKQMCGKGMSQHMR